MAKKRFTLKQKEECSKRFGISIESVNKYISQRGIDITDHGAVEAYRKQIRTSDQPSGDIEDLKEEILKEELIYKQKRNEKLAIQIDQERGLLMDIAEVKELFIRIAIVDKKMAETQEGELPPLIENMSARDIRPIVAAKTKEALTIKGQISKYDT